MKNPIIYRKRLIPEECILLKDDIILKCTDSMIVTQWNTLKPKKELHHGFSCYYLDKGFKVSQFCREDNSLLYWYCDIIDSSYNPTTNELVVTDLLADVIIYPNGFVKVVDLDEIVSALDSGLLSDSQLKQALMSLNNLLTIIYRGKFDSLKSEILSFTDN